MELSKAPKAPQTRTALHERVRHLIQDAGFIYDEEWNVPGTLYRLDFYLPEFHVGVEADGPFHRQGKDDRRDKIILETSGILVVRFKGEAVSNKMWRQSLSFLIRFCDAAWISKQQRMMVN